MAAGSVFATNNATAATNRRMVGFRQRWRHKSVGYESAMAITVASIPTARQSQRLSLAPISTVPARQRIPRPQPGRLSWTMLINTRRHADGECCPEPRALQLKDAAQNGNAQIDQELPRVRALPVQAHEHEIQHAQGGWDRNELFRASRHRLCAKDAGQGPTRKPQ